MADANHISAIFAKLQVADRTWAILRARDAGLGNPDGSPLLSHHCSGADRTLCYLREARFNAKPQVSMGM
jgi:hypothetical protein